MSDTIETKKILVMRDCVVGKKCDICGKEIPPTVIPHRYGEPVYDYYEVTTHHNSVDSYEHFDACSPDCAHKLWEKYLLENSMCIKVEHINCWTRKDTAVTR